MKYEEIKKLMDDMGESKLTSINIEFPDGIKISMKKEMRKHKRRKTRYNTSSSNCTNISKYRSRR